MAPTIQRELAIKAILHNWIANEEDCLGALVTDDNFEDLANAVTALRKLGRSKNWQAAVDYWMDKVTFAWEVFCQQNEMQPGVRHSELTMTTGREFARLIKWAMHQGLVECWACK